MNSAVIQSAVQESDVYVGLWTDWSHGSIAGATLTLTKRDGGLLTAFIAVFVTVIGERFWFIVSFVAHMILSREGAQDGIYHQRQAILHNASPSAALWRLFRISWAWRRHHNASLFKRIFPSLLLSFITLSAFAAAGIFSSRVATSTGGEVLISSLHCGLLNPDITQADAGVSMDAYAVHSMQFSFNYALSCYRNTSSTEDCPRYPRESLPFNITKNNACPFPGQERICRNSSATIQLDSGFINSHFDLGINAPPENRFLYRTIRECTPLHNEGYTRRVNVTRGSNSSTFYPVVDFLYGSTYGYENSTYRYSARLPMTSSTRDGTRGISEYILLSQTYYAPGAKLDELSEWENEWSPIPELLIPDGDVTILFLSANDIRFLDQVDDPWYSAHTPAGEMEIRGANFSAISSLPIYVRDDPVRALGCIERFQFCNPNVSNNFSCTPLGGITQAVQLAPDLYQNEVQRAHVKWSATMIISMSAGLSAVSNFLGTSSLQSRSTLMEGRQSSLPENQWEVEIESWFKVIMADLQRVILEQATGPTQPAIRQFLTRPNNTEEHQVCANQKIRSDSFTSFNVLGLTIIFALGGLITLISFVLPIAVERVQRRRNPYSSVEWIANETLQLQRLAHEAVGAGTWQGTHTDWPTTAQTESLAVLDMSHPKHPKLKVAAKKDELSDSSGTTIASVQVPGTSIASVQVPGTSIASVQVPERLVTYGQRSSCRF
ncbi:hypothetical protein GJ744_001263 [Endocarpon pusillum]|uniref:Uncharacterized protein n=1 Tax=Endocarpon pusillum TaxID=364733 RepID=A0A8H7E1Z5_9EURO|nr:hypothetical protein GJ744_001263 [Endocarpon pusillum]